VCYFHDNYKYSSLKLENIQKNENVILEFEIKTPGKYYFSLNQINKRFFCKSKHYKYSNLGFMLSRTSPSGQSEYVGSGMKSDKENWIGEECKPGTYRVLIKANWRSFVREFSFSVYGPGIAKINKVEDISLKYLTSVFTHHAKTAPNLTTRKVSSKNVQYKLFDTNGGYGYFFFTNNESAFNFDTTIELTSSRNVKIIYPGNSSKLSLKVPPKKSKIVIYEATGFPYSTAMKISSSFSKASNQDDMMKSTLSLGKKTILDQNIHQTINNLANGRSIVFENVSNDIYQLNVVFELNNCHIRGHIGNSVHLFLNPKQSSNILIRKDAYANTFSAKILKAEGTSIPCYES
jgi:hypothetical protein